MTRQLYWHLLQGCLRHSTHSQASLSQDNPREEEQPQIQLPVQNDNRGTKGSEEVPWGEPSQRLYWTKSCTFHRFSTIHLKRKQRSSVLHWLLKAECTHKERSILTPSYWQDSSLNLSSKDLHQAWYLLSLSLHSYELWIGGAHHVQNSLWIL